jgi:2-succinyl-6-hydroxy-2,4-cyclohexadiene-1-carboxylate synthase
MAPALVLLHGFTHTGASWEPVVAGLGERYRPLAPDIRGHGSAADRTPVDLSHVIEDVSELAPGSFTLVGYSMGARIALHVALELADRVQRLILIGGSPGLADPAQRADRRAADEQLAREIEGSTIEQFARSWARTPVLADQPPQVAAAVHADRLRSTPTGLARALRGLGTGVLPSVWDRLVELTMPTELIVGARDDKFVQIGSEMVSKMSLARLVVVPDSGHAVHLEQPVPIAALIAQVGGVFRRKQQ